MKVRTNILIEESILRTAQELGINVSKYCENALRIGIEALKNTQNQIRNQNETLPPKTEGSAETVRFSQTGGVGFEPTTTSLGGLRPIHARLPALNILRQIQILT